MNPQVIRMEIDLNAPYSFDKALAYLHGSPSAVLEQIDTNNNYRRAVTVAGRDVLLVLRSTGTAGRPRLVLEVHGDIVSPAMTIQAVQLVRRIFSLDANPQAFEAIGACDPVLSALIQRFRGLRPVLIADPYESLLWAVIGQQVNVSFARKLKLTLVEICGRRLRINGHNYLLLPRPVDVAALDELMLRAHQFSRRKAAYLVGLSRAVVDGRLNLGALQNLPYEEAVATLTRFNGIGRWTAEYVLMRGLGAQDVIPAGDLGLRRVIGQAYGLGQTATETQIRLVAEQCAGWRSWVAFYWWFALQQAAILKRQPVPQRGDADNAG